MTVAETGYWYYLEWKYCEKRKVFSLALKDDRVEQCLVGANSKCGVQRKRRCESHESCVCIVGFPACGCQKKSVVYETECRHAAVQTGKQDQNYLYSTETHTSYFILNTFWNGKPVQFFQERCWVVVTGCQENKSCSKVLNFLERLDNRIRCTHRSQLQ